MSDFLAKLRAKAKEQAEALEKAGQVPPAAEKPTTGPEIVVPPKLEAPVPPHTEPTDPKPAAPVQAVRPLMGLRLPSVAQTRPTTPVSQSVSTVGQPSASPAAQPADPAPVQPAKPAGLQLGANLAKLLNGSGPSSIVPAARPALVAPTGYQPCYSAAEFIEDWNALEVAGDPTVDEQAAIFRKASARIGELFENELIGVAIPLANEHSITEIAALVNLTFIRVKDAPSAWAVLDRLDKSKVIAGMRATAAKRNSAVKGRKKTDADALSTSFTEAAALTAGFDDEDLGDFGEIDLGFSL